MANHLAHGCAQMLRRKLAWVMSSLVQRLAGGLANACMWYGKPHSESLRRPY
jgi:hypothetical protein